jgi:hypothetical protein
MTEADWGTATDPDPMLLFLRDKVSEHQLRLFAVACCRRIEHLLTDERSRRSVEVAELYSRNEASPTALESAALAAKAAYETARARALGARAPDHAHELIAEGEALIAEGVAQASYIVADAHFGLGSALAVVFCTAEAACGLNPPNAESAVQAALLRELIAYPGGSG